MTAEKSSSKTSQLVPIAPDGGWGWVVVLGSFFIHVFADGFVYSFGVLVEVLMKEFKSDNTVSAMIISLLTGLTLGSGPLASAITNKYGCRTTAIIGSFIASTGYRCAASYFATAMWHIVLSVGVIMGVGFGLMYCPAIVIVTMYFEKRRSLATGIAVAGAGVGTVLFSPINEYIISHHGWRAVFLTFLAAKLEDISGILAISVLCGWTFRPLKFREVTENGESDETDEFKKPALGDVKVESIALLTPEKPVNSNCHGILRDAKSLIDVNHSHDAGIGERDVGYLNRKDVFYTGSITNVAEFKEHPDRFRSTGSLHRHTPAALSAERLQEVKEDSEETSEETSTDNVEGKNMFKTISKMLSLSLLLDPTFLIFSISNLLTSVGFNSPLYFLPLHATKGVGLDTVSSSRVLSVFGLCNTLGRVVFGVVADHRLPLPYKLGEDTVRNRLWMYNLSLSICGLLTAFCYLCKSFISLSIYAGLFGFSISSYICLTSVILVDLLGLDKLTNAFGLLLLWQGVGTVFGPPISGYLADITNTYVWSFVFCGANLLISGMMLFSIPYFRNKQSRQTVSQYPPEEERQLNL
ncbi:transporter, major facilitator family protein [Dictyocaulus viviparus]|uniref:Transporter, major facilitator family protein n=1 Tax=Dictyocaulus viviparus TaxID=29172 RepID=A0A0D8XUB3_DICVI|nr:transporter, major facilitator family protein [Dictyocaulus viviparus]